MRFEHVTAFADDFDLLSEEIDGATGELFSNFPQAFTHIGLVNATNAIAEAEAPSRRGEARDLIRPPEGDPKGCS